MRWSDVVREIGEYVGYELSSDAETDARVAALLPSHRVDPSWPVRPTSMAMYLAETKGALMTLHQEGAICLEVMEDTTYLATEEAIVEVTDGKGCLTESEATEAAAAYGTEATSMTYLRPMCRNDPSRAIRDVVREHYAVHGLRFLPKVTSEVTLARDVTWGMVNEVLEAITSTSGSVPEGADLVLFRTRASGMTTEVGYGRGHVPVPASETSRRDAVLFDLLCSWAEPRASQGLYVGGRRHVDSSYERAEATGAYAIPSSPAATVRVIGRRRAEERLGDWLRAIGASPQLARGEPA